MDAFPQILGLTGQEITQLAILAVALLIGLFLLRLAFRLTATLLRVGCIGIFIIVALVFAFQLFSF
jgi:hypothetical protein